MTTVSEQGCRRCVRAQGLKCNLQNPIDGPGAAGGWMAVHPSSGAAREPAGVAQPAAERGSSRGVDDHCEGRAAGGAVIETIGRQHRWMWRREAGRYASLLAVRRTSFPPPRSPADACSHGRRSRGVRGGASSTRRTNPPGRCRRPRRRHAGARTGSSSRGRWRNTRRSSHHRAIARDGYATINLPDAMMWGEKLSDRRRKQRKQCNRLANR